MRRVCAILGMVFVAGAAALAQGSSPSPAAPAKPGTGASTAPHVAAKPTAIIDTTAGKMTCTLFPDKAPIGVANFIGLAKGTKDWKSPVSGATKHGVPLYDGLIFHRVIPEFMIQGGDPAGTGAGLIRSRRSRMKFRPTCCLTSLAAWLTLMPAQTPTARSFLSPRLPSPGNRVRCSTGITRSSGSAMRLPSHWSSRSRP